MACNLSISTPLSKRQIGYQIQSGQSDSHPSRSAVADLAGIPIPSPRPRVLARIADLAEMIAGDGDPIYFGPRRLLGGYRLCGAGISIIGTACRRPLLFDEAREVQRIIGDDLVLVRLEDLAAQEAEFTYDLLPSQTDEWVSNTRLWREPEGSSLWLIPSVGGAQFIHLSKQGIHHSVHAPFLNSDERDAGILAAGRQLGGLR